MADSTSGAITFTGLGSGTDFASLVDGLVDIERSRITRLESWRLEWETKVTAFQELNSKMLSLQTTLAGMDTVNEFMTKTVTSSEEAVLTATADADAAPTSHIVEVKQLAQNKVFTSTNGFEKVTDYVNQTGSAQDFSYTYKGETITVSIADSTTMEGMVNAINNHSENPGVRASIVSDGSEYYISFRGMDLGAEATLTLNDAGTTLSGFSSSDFEVVQENQNSQIKVDGWPTGADQYISNASNTVTGAIEGVTLNLKAGLPGYAINLTIDSDMEGIKQNIRDFVDAVNDVRSFINSVTAVDDSGSTSVSVDQTDDLENNGSILTGNYGVQIISQRLKDITASIGPGFDYWDTSGSTPTGDRYTSLSQLGILTDADRGSVTQGLLTLDEEELDKALETDFDAVVAMFAADGVGGTKNTDDFSYVSKIDTLTEPGSYDVSYKVDAAGNIYDAYINGFAAKVNNDTHEITALSHKTKVGETSVEQNGAVGMLIRVDNLTEGEYPPAGTAAKDQPAVTIKQGKTGELISALKDLTDDETGPLAILEENYGDIMDSIDSKIAYEEARIAKLEETWRLKYARLDALLGQYESQSSSLSSSIAQLSSD